MKFISNFILIVLILLTLSCDNKVKEKDSKIISKNNSSEIVKEDSTTTYAKTEFQISGMTCEIGCARLIQSRLSKTNGVKTIKVVFEDSIGYIEYDKTKLSNKKIKQIVENIAGGDIYTVKKINEVSEFSLKK